ncbi:MAG: hypothetical protein U1D30_21105 [Planctomycetota bacterium]
MSGTKQRLPRLALARFSRLLPASWRLWLMGWLIAVFSQLSAYFTAALAAFLAWVIWNGLHEHASLYLDAVEAGNSKSTSQRRLGDFMAGALVLGALAIQGLFSLDAALGDAPRRIPIIVLMATLAGACFAFSMTSMWWRFSFAVATSAWLLGAGSLAVWFAADPVPRSFSLLEGWGQNIVRWILVLLVAEWLEWYAGPRRKATLVEREVGMLTPAFGIGLALLSRPPGALEFLPSNQVSIWVGVAALLAVALGVLLGFGRFRAARDLAWASSFIRQGRQRSGPATAGLFSAIAFTPAIALAPVATWPAWGSVFFLGFLSILIKSTPRVRRSGRIRQARSPVSSDDGSTRVS